MTHKNKLFTDNNYIVYIIKQCLSTDELQVRGIHKVCCELDWWRRQNILEQIQYRPDCFGQKTELEPYSYTMAYRVLQVSSPAEVRSNSVLKMRKWWSRDRYLRDTEGKIGSAEAPTQNLENLEGLMQLSLCQRSYCILVGLLTILGFIHLCIYYENVVFIENWDLFRAQTHGLVNVDVKN